MYNKHLNIVISDFILFFFSFIIYLFMLPILISIALICLLLLCFLETNPPGHRPGKLNLVMIKRN